MKTYRRENIDKRNNKSKKIISQSDIVSVSYYSKVFKNTKLIPKTKIINYMFSGYKEYIEHKKLSDDLGKYTLDLEDCFIIKPNDMPSGLRKDEINLSLKMNPSTSLYKLIAYSFYLKQEYIFQNTDGLSNIKYQIGKDIKRSERTINGKLFDGEYYRQIEDNYLSADLFYQNIIDYLYQINHKNVNINMANIFALLSCQNVFNLITDLITIKLNKILEPEMNSVFRPDKHINIIINKNEISMELYFKSQLIISRDGEPIDPEYPCGNVEFNMYIDLLNNKYELKKFNLSYDIDKCGPEKVLIETKEPKTESNLKAEYLVPAGVITAGIIATPFLIASLGGKTKKNKKKMRRTRRRKLKSYYTDRKKNI